MKDLQKDTKNTHTTKKTQQKTKQPKKTKANPNPTPKRPLQTPSPSTPYNARMMWWQRSKGGRCGDPQGSSWGFAEEWGLLVCLRTFQFLWEANPIGLCLGRQMGSGGGVYVVDVFVFLLIFLVGSFLVKKLCSLRIFYFRGS